MNKGFVLALSDFMTSCAVGFEKGEEGKRGRGEEGKRGTGKGEEGKRRTGEEGKRRTGGTGRCSGRPRFPFSPVPLFPFSLSPLALSPFPSSPLPLFPSSPSTPAYQQCPMPCGRAEVLTLIPHASSDRSVQQQLFQVLAFPTTRGLR